MAVWDEYFSDWDFIVSLFPEGWQEKFHELKVLKFGRKFTGENKESDLLRLIFLHLAGGLSLRTTVAEAREAGIVDIVDVTLSNHFIRALLPAEFSLRFVLKNWNKVKLKLAEHTRKRVSASAWLRYIASLK